MNSVYFTVDVPPSTNHIYVRNRWTGGVILSSEGKAYIQSVKDVIARVLQGRTDLQEDLSVRGVIVKVKIVVVMPCLTGKSAKHAYKRIDSTGKIKLLEDCVAEAMGYDDLHNFSFTACKIPQELTNLKPCTLVCVDVFPPDYMEEYVHECLNEFGF